MRTWQFCDVHIYDGDLQYMCKTRLFTLTETNKILLITALTYGVRCHKCSSILGRICAQDIYISMGTQ